jgi:hypothetical protein
VTGDTAVEIGADPTHDDEAVMNGAPGCQGAKANTEILSCAQNDERKQRGHPADPTYDDEAVMNGAPKFVSGPPANSRLYYWSKPLTGPGTLHSYLPD